MRTTTQIEADLWAVLDWPLVRVDDVWRAAVVRLANDVPGLIADTQKLEAENRRLIADRAANEKANIASRRSLCEQRDRYLINWQSAELKASDYNDEIVAVHAERDRLREQLADVCCEECRRGTDAALRRSNPETPRSTAASPQPRGTASTAPGGAVGATNLLDGYVPEVKAHAEHDALEQATGVCDCPTKETQR